MPYIELIRSVGSITENVPHFISNLANVSSLIYNSLTDINWAGFYLLEGETLVLGPFQGRPACIELAPGKGVCQAAIAKDRTLVVDDVNDFPGHIACDPMSASEIVIPLHKDGKTIGCLDIDSPVIGRFKKEDAEGLCAAVRELEKNI